MKIIKEKAGFTLIEALVSTAVFALFAVAIYGAFQMVLKAVYKSRINIVQTALLSEYLEIARNLPFDNIGTINGLPAGVIPQSTTTIRNGISFQVVTQIRNIDDPFDGTLGGSPNDTAPADYKLVEITVTCLSCEHPTENSVSTIIPPNDLEGDSNNGAIFIYVSDSSNNPIAGASVEVINTSSVPNIFINDVTDNNGYLRIVDTPTGTMSYNIIVSKTGFSTDYTSPSSTENPDPAKKRITVTAQQISETFFSIDRLGSMSVHTLDESCDPISNAAFNLSGDKLLGAPNLKKYSADLQTDAEGNINIEDLEFDVYSFLFAGTYDLGGSLPIEPVDLVAGSHKDVTLILSPHVSNSLLVKVVDNSNDLPIADATVQLNKTGYLSTQKTNYGNFSQTDWSGGSGQIDYTEEFPNMFTNNSFVEVGISPGNISLTEFAGQYVSGGTLESSIIDFGKRMDLLNVQFAAESWPVEAGEQAILLQLAVSNSSSPATLNNFVGPDGTAGTFYSSTSTIIYTAGESYRYLRYKLFLSTEDQDFTPIFSEFSITFTNGCTPPGQVFFKGMSADTYALTVSADTFDTVSTTVDISGRSSSTIRLFKTL